jgi:hypothetical protein
MNKKMFFGTVGILAVIASIVMYIVGGNSSHLSELKQFWWYPLPLAVICFLVAGAKKKGE